MESEMNKKAEIEYQRYLDYMHGFEAIYGYYPLELSNGQWTPYSMSEYLDKTNNGVKTLESYFIN